MINDEIINAHLKIYQYNKNDLKLYGNEKVFGLKRKGVLKIKNKLNNKQGFFLKIKVFLKHTRVCGGRTDRKMRGVVADERADERIVKCGGLWRTKGS